MSRTPLSTDDEMLRDCLALCRAPLIGSLRYRRLIERFGSPRGVFQAGRTDWEGLGLPAQTLEYLARPDWKTVEADLIWLREGGSAHACLTWDHAAYPERLRQIPDPPPVLFVKGNTAALAMPQIAMVGSRSPTPGGQRIARELARGLAASGLVIVSGLAVGIDAASHEGTLEAGGVTIAVAGTGLDRVYPRHHAALADRLLEAGGALVSEYPPGTGPLAANFPRRNRIISGLALGTVVVEAALRSGSLITARMALEQNRDVFAVPGSIYSPQSQGCNRLIQEGAKLVQGPVDILEEYPQWGMSRAQELAFPTGPRSSEPESGLLKFIAYEPTTVDTLVAATGLSADTIGAQLLDLELCGRVASVPGGGFMRVR